MTQEFHREYLVRLPLPIAQLYSRAYNAKDHRGRHDNSFYLFESLIKLAASTAIAAYLQEAEHAAHRVPAIDRLLAQLALPSLGQWMAMLRELARHFGRRVDAAHHPLGHLSQQLEQSRRDLPGMLALYRRIKNGPDGQPVQVQSCSLLQVFEALVQYRNGVFGHGGLRFPSFYEQEMGPLLFPAANELLADEAFELLGPRGTRLVYLTELRMVDDGQVELGLRELVGLQGERAAPLLLASAQATALAPNRVAVLWPGRAAPVRLDPLLVYRESELAEEVLFLNRDRNRQHVEYLSYTTGRTERDRNTGPALAALLSRVTDRPVRESDLDVLAEQSLAETPSVEAWFEPEVASARQLGDFEILGELGRGGMGVVYLARQLSLGRLVALKMLPADLAGDEVALARFRREIRHLARCEHPHIVKVLSSGAFADGQHYYSMEYVPGCDLEHVWRELSIEVPTSEAAQLSSSTWARAVYSASQKQRAHVSRPATVTLAERPTADSIMPPLPEIPLPTDVDDPGGYARRVAMLIRDAASAVQAVHDQQIVHRDVKPANLMLTPDGSRLVLMDFGLAKGQTMTLSASRQGGLLGTLRYAAPEQLAAAHLKVGPAADVRALGVTLWELLTRRRLFGEADSEARLMQDVLLQDVPRLRSIDASLDRDLEAIVARATERRASDRIASAGQLAEYLQMYLDGRPLPIRPPNAQEMAWRWVQSHKPLVGSAVVATAMILATTGVAFFSIYRAERRAVQARDDATRARDFAQREGELALKALNALVFDIQEKLAPLPAAVDVRRDLLEQALSGLEELGNSLADDSRIDRNKLAAHEALGRVFLSIGNLDGLSGTEQARLQFQRALVIGQHLAEAAPADVDAQRDLSSCFNNLGDVCMQSGAIAQARAWFEKALVIDRRLHAADPQDPLAQKDLAFSYSQLGDVSRQLGAVEEARDWYSQSLAIQEKLLAADADDVPALRNLCVAYERLGDLSRQLEQVEQAQQWYEKDLAISKRLLALNSNDIEAQRDLAISYARLGDVVRQLQGTKPARELYEKAAAIREKLAAENPGDLSTQRDLAISYNELAGVSLEAGAIDEARQWYEKDLAISEKLAKADPQNVEGRRDLSVTFGQLADICSQQKKMDQARRWYEQALAIDLALAEIDPSDAQAQRDLSVTYINLGDVRRETGALAEARRYYEKAHAMREKVAAGNSRDTQAQRDLITGHTRLGRTCVAGYQFAEGVQRFEHAQEIVQRLVQEQRLVATDSVVPEVESLLTGGRRSKSAVEDSEFIAAQPIADRPALLADRACGLAVQEQIADAIAAADMLRNLEPRNGEHLYRAASAYGLCASATGKDQAQLTAEESAQCRKHVELALQTLREALAAGYQDFDRLGNDPSFHLCRDRPEFKDLLATRPQTPSSDGKLR
jgi:serine/threonine protein kinase/tetratricopeptide (TPR) repeat protein